MHLCLIIIFGKVSGGMIYGCHMGVIVHPGVAILKGTFKGKNI